METVQPPPRKEVKSRKINGIEVQLLDDPKYGPSFYIPEAQLGDDLFDNVLPLPENPFSQKEVMDALPDLANKSSSPAGLAHEIEKFIRGLLEEK